MADAYLSSFIVHGEIVKRRCTLNDPIVLSRRAACYNIVMMSNRHYVSYSSEDAHLVWKVDTLESSP